MLIRIEEETISQLGRGVICAVILLVVHKHLDGHWAFVKMCENPKCFINCSMNNQSSEDSDRFCNVSCLVFIICHFSV